jgi:hypothetical protein
MKIYFDAFVECVAKNRLSNTVDGKLPSRVAHLTKYPEDMVEEPKPLAKGATDADRRDFDKEAARRFERRRENKEIELKIAVAVRDDESSLFTLLSDSMKETNPGLRDNLRELYQVSGAPGHFTGSTALAKIKADLTAQVAEGTYDKYYDEVLRHHETNRLKEGCLPSEFSAKVRTFVHYTNPFLRRPYKGDAIGKFIIENILPSAYNEAGDRITADCERDKCLHDPVEVERRCLQKVAKCQKQTSKAVVAAHGSPHGLAHDFEDGAVERKMKETEGEGVNAYAAAVKRLLDEMSSIANAGANGARKPGGPPRTRAGKPVGFIRSAVACSSSWSVSPSLSTRWSSFSLSSPLPLVEAPSSSSPSSSPSAPSPSPLSLPSSSLAFSPLFSSSDVMKLSSPLSSSLSSSSSPSSSPRLSPSLGSSWEPATLMSASSRLSSKSSSSLAAGSSQALAGSCSTALSASNMFAAILAISAVMCFLRHSGSRSSLMGTPPTPLGAQAHSDQHARRARSGRLHGCADTRSGHEGRHLRRT